MAKITSISIARREAGGKADAANPKEMLAVVTALVFIEQHALITRSQLNDAKRSIQALFLRTSGEETMLRKLIRVLRVNRDLHQAFSAISKISLRISTSVEVISRKIKYLNQYASKLTLTPEENSTFFAPFLAFTHQFQNKILTFSKQMESYLAVKEIEARRTHEFRIAQEASERLRNRLSGKLGAELQGEVESTIRQEVLETFDYAEAQANLREAQRNSRVRREEISELLQELKAMCQMAMNPDMREKQQGGQSQNHPAQDDIFVRFTTALKRFPRLAKIKDFILDYFKLYQRAYGMFVLDFDNLNKAADTISTNPDEYFDAKQEDEDIKVKLEKLKKIEGLIPFLETTALALVEDENMPFQQYSRNMSAVISTKPSQWEHISEDLLVAKVTAEADLNTRI
jgi:transcriptional regulator NrdR family protein